MFCDRAARHLARRPRSDETVFSIDEAGLKPGSAIRRTNSKTGCVKMMEAVTGILGLLCVVIFVAHAVDAYLMP